MNPEACGENPDCKYFERGMCRTDTHHLFYPANQYQDPIERAFRNLPENKVLTCREEHEIIHATQEEPVKPSIEVMEHAIIASGVHISNKARKRLRM